MKVKCLLNSPEPNVTNVTMLVLINELPKRHICYYKYIKIFKIIQWKSSKYSHLRSWNHRVFFQ